MALPWLELLEEVEPSPEELLPGREGSLEVSLERSPELLPVELEETLLWLEEELL